MRDIREAFGGWLSTRPGFEAARVVSALPVEGGASNLTYHVQLEGAPEAAVALRVQRDEGIFAPYDVHREGRVIERLRGSPVPVPRLIAVVDDRSVLGAPFIVLEWVDAPHMGVAGPEADFGAYVVMVATIHGLDWRALGLDFLAAADDAGSATRQELEAVVRRMAVFGCDDDPTLRQARDRLRARVPGDGGLALCQGDINVFNYLFREGKVVAVVDWEQARIGDPRSDLGQLVALSHLKGAPWAAPREVPFIQAYEAAAGHAVEGLEFFRAFWLFQLGVIYHGWVAYNGTLPWYEWDHLVSLLETALAEVG